MVKPKRTHLAVMKSNGSQNSAENPSSIVDSDVSWEDDWVVVKKQRVNIWIPPVTSTEPSMLPDPGQTQLPGDMPGNSTNTPIQLSDENPLEICPAERNDGSLPSSPKINVLSTEEDYPSLNNIGGSVAPCKSSPRKVNNEHQITSVSALHKGKRSMMHTTSFGLKPFRSRMESGLYGIGNMVSANTYRDKMMKASNLERKIVRAGGLDRWLSSLGLQQFTRIFHGKKINKFQLANLSMKKLKDMGAHAVGPRRKLIHAIEWASHWPRGHELYNEADILYLRLLCSSENVAKLLLCKAAYDGCCPSLQWISQLQPTSAPINEEPPHHKADLLQIPYSTNAFVVVDDDKYGNKQVVSLTPRLYDYVLSNVREPEVLRELREETATMRGSQMQVSPDQAQLLAMLVQLMGATRCIEVGVFTGYSSLAVALALPEFGCLVACERDEKVLEVARRFYERAGVLHKVQIKRGLAIDSLNSLLSNGEAGSYDFAFIDAEKKIYTEYFELLLKLVRVGGIIVVDNVLWHGKVADPLVNDPKTVSLRKFNKAVMEDERVSISLVPIGDGMTICRKRWEL